MGTQGKLEVTKKDKITIVNFLEVAFLDEVSIKSLGDELEGIVKEENYINLVINFQNVDYLSSAVLGRLVKIYKLVKRNKGKMKLCCIKKNILHVFKITKLDRMFEIFKNQEKAISSFKKKKFKFFWSK